MRDTLAFGPWLREQRRSWGLTQNALAQQVGCAISTLEKIEAGAARPSKQLATLLAGACDVPLPERPAFVAWARGVGDPPRLPSDVAAHRTMLSPASPFLEAPTSFIGREDDIAALVGLLQRAVVRLVTVTGPAGIGKTRVSLQVLRAIAPQFTDGAVYVALAAVSDPDRVASSICAALGVVETADRPLIANLMATLVARNLLLVLDNFEQALAAAPLLGQILEAAPRLKVLVTSRAALRLYGEHEFPLPPMDVPQLPDGAPLTAFASAEAVQLFVARARAVRRTFSLSPDSAPAVAAICARLDGLPLAIELAATRVRLLAPDALLDQLGNAAFTLNMRGTRDVTSRQHTLQGALDWSYQLLTAAERQLFARLAVFHGGCSFSAVAAIAGTEDLAVDDLVPSLEALVDHNLLQARGTPRVRLG